MQWWGTIENEDDLYVPISRSDWDNILELELLPLLNGEDINSDNIEESSIKDESSDDDSESESSNDRGEGNDSKDDEDGMVKDSLACDPAIIDALDAIDSDCYSEFDSASDSGESIDIEKELVAFANEIDNKKTAKDKPCLINKESLRVEEIEAMAKAL